MRSLLLTGLWHSIVSPFRAPAADLLRAELLRRQSLPTTRGMKARSRGAGSKGVAPIRKNSLGLVVGYMSEGRRRNSSVEKPSASGNSTVR